MPSQGAKIRSTYIAYAKKEVTRLHAAIASLHKEVAEKRAEEARLKAALEHTESVDAAALDHQKQSRESIIFLQNMSKLTNFLGS